MKLSQLKQILAESNIRLTKSLGQNFLHDGNQLRRIVAAGELAASDRVLEIGPGLGPLTDSLLAQAGEVFAIEKDRRLVELLCHRFPGASFGERLEASQRHSTGPAPGVESCAHGIPEAHLPGEVGDGSARLQEHKLLLEHDDALKFLQRESRDWSDWKMVSNLPYSAASPILVELAQVTGCPERMVVTVQREVAQRIVANPGDKEYGLLTLLIQLRYEPHGWFKVPAGCFFPRPDVDSACITLLRRSKPLLNQEQAGTFTKIVKRAFSQRRKMMLKLLREDWPEEKLVRAFETLGISPGERADELSLEQFVVLAKSLFSHG